MVEALFLAAFLITQVRGKQKEHRMEQKLAHLPLQRQPLAFDHVKIGASGIPSLSVAIVSFNTVELLFGCLKSLFETCNNIELDVVVVDNGSSDGSVEMVRTTFPHVRLIVNQHNVGFGLANNQAVAIARGEYVLLLNSDTVVWPGAIAQLLRHFEQNPSLGVVGPYLIGINGLWQRSAFRFPTPPVLLLGELNLAQFARMYWSRNHQSRASHSVDWLIGACLLGRRDVLASFGPFDTHFFMYAEDIDLCYRIRQAGWDIMFVPDVKITHLGGMSSRRNRVQMALQATESMYLFYRKHYSQWSLLLAVLIFRSVALLKLLRDLARWIWLMLVNVKNDQRNQLLEDLDLWVHIFSLQPPNYVVDDTRRFDQVRMYIGDE